MDRLVSRRVYWTALAISSFVAWPYAKTSIYPPYNRKKDASDKTVILTGATGCLGTATAYNLARRNCRLIMACRNMEKCKSLRRELVLLTKNHSISCRRLNLEDIDSINEFADDIIKNEPRIDTLINSAGVRDVPQKELTKYGIEKNFWLNFLAPYLLTFRLLDKLKESAKQTKDSRIVNVIGHPKKSWTLDPDDINFENRRYSSKEAYRQSKLALAHFTITFNKFFNHTNVRAFGVSPPNLFQIMPILDHPEDSILVQAYRFISTYWNISSHNACSTSVLCAVDDHILKEDRTGGGCYNYIIQNFGRSKGWGPIGFQELDSQYVWNLGAKLLLRLPANQPASNIGQYNNNTNTKSDLNYKKNKS